MPSANSDTDRFVSSLHRSILGVLLAILAFAAFGMGSETLVRGNPLGILGILVGLGATYWIIDLLRQGMREA